MAEGFYVQTGKRCFDLAVGAFAFVLLLIPQLFVALMVLLFLGRPVLFRQRRSGRLGQSFTLLKFRSMNDRRDATGKLLPDSIRLTRLGRFLRSTSLDELPALWNVLRGDLSLIGPRPLPIQYTPLYDTTQRRRLDLRPGMAGYAALFGRNAQSWESIFAHDVWYVEHVSLLLDLKVILGILRVVVSREGIDRGDHSNSSEFQQRIDAASREGSYVYRA
jgi:lipopolysaccharide/colanic/teichoic acid biosynthesis glycosyltransferase